MSTLRVVLALSCLFLLVSPAIAAQLGEEFELKAGDSIQVGEDGLTVEFSRTLLDTRCPIGVICFWEGDASVLITARIQDRSAEMELHTYADFGDRDKFEGYEVRLLTLSPYPVLDQPIDPDDYVVGLVVNKTSVPVSPLSWSVLKGHFR